MHPDSVRNLAHPLPRRKHLINIPNHNGLTLLSEWDSLSSCWVHTSKTHSITHAFSEETRLTLAWETWKAKKLHTDPSKFTSISRVEYRHLRASAWCQRRSEISTRYLGILFLSRRHPTCRRDRRLNKPLRTSCKKHWNNMKRISSKPRTHKKKRWTISIKPLKWSK